MADTKISALPASTTPLAGTEVLPIVQSGVTRQVSVANLTAGRAVSAASVTASTGNFVVGTAGQGIDFSVTPGTGTSELLNDYEEGTWSPVYQTTGGSFTYSIQTGSYTKIGNTVYCNFRISTATVTAGTGNVLLAGLPFTQNSSTNVRGSFGIGDSRSFGGDVPAGLVTEETGTTTLKITYRTAANGGVTNLDASDLAPTGAFQNIIAGSFFYTV
jgi:hypothetical protein